MGFLQLLSSVLNSLELRGLLSDLHRKQWFESWRNTYGRFRMMESWISSNQPFPGSKVAPAPVGLVSAFDWID